MKEEKDVTGETISSIGVIAFIVVVLCCLFEVGLLAYAYFNADKVTCNWIWCEFTQERTTMESRAYSECYRNNVKINCSDDISNIDVDELMDKIHSHNK